MTATFCRASYHRHLEALAQKDERLQQILRQWGYPPFWSRPDGFPGLVRIILEQQVSLASAQSTWNRLKHYIEQRQESQSGPITPASILALSDPDLENLGITRQKRRYIRGLAAELEAPCPSLNLQHLPEKTDDEVRAALTTVKGIGPWTADIYLIMGLHRMDVFPAKDLALNKALDSLGILPLSTPSPQVYDALESFAPYRSLLACLLWHWYIQAGKSQRA